MPAAYTGPGRNIAGKRPVSADLRGPGCGLTARTRQARRAKFRLRVSKHSPAMLGPKSQGMAMNLYHCSIDLQNNAKAMAFAVAVEAWMEHLKANGVIQQWRLCRRKMGFGAPRARDFLLEIEVEDLTQLDKAFRFTATRDERVERLYTTVHQMVGEVDVALYRPFPDPERAERMALI
jgi:hypothetical protein